MNHTLDLVKVCISIHAPAWGATTRVAHGINIKKYFNPRSRVGSDVFAQMERELTADFNPRSRVGSDQSDTLVLVALLNFNPRSRVGSDAQYVSAAKWA